MATQPSKASRQMEQMATIQHLIFGVPPIRRTRISGLRIGRDDSPLARHSFSGRGERSVELSNVLEKRPYLDNHRSFVLIVTSTRRFVRSRAISASNSACGAFGATGRGGTRNLVEPRPRASI